MGWLKFGWTYRPPCLSKGNLNTPIYRDYILDAYEGPFAGAICDAFVLQEDNARPQRACIEDDYLQQKTIMRLEWLAGTPD